MAVSAKSKSRVILVEEPVADGGMNDNNPGMHPGHELSDLRNVPCQPAAEASIHYARLAMIESFPQAPQSASSTVATAPSLEASAEREENAKPPQRNVVMACLSSFACHAAVIAMLVVGFVVTPHDPVEEAGEVVSVIILGDSEADQAAAGEKAEEPQPEQIVAETAQTQTVQPTAATPTETVTTEPVTVAPTQEVTRVSPENIVAAEPEVLTSPSSAETSFVQPMATEVPLEVPAETPPVAQAEEIKPVQPVETAAVAPEPDKPTPEPKLKAEKPVKKPIEKKEPPKKAQPSAGSGGENEQDSERGSADGTETATSNQNSRGAGSSGGAGSAAVANYPGKIQSRIRRSVRVPSEYKRMSASMSVRVRLTIGASGDLSGLSIARSSGIPELDQAVVEGIRRAAPFPRLPVEWGKPVWSFSQDVQVTGH